jgi:hypothetical protein
MLTIRGLRQRLCDGVSRREFLRVGSLGALGVSLPNLLQASTSAGANDASFGKAKRCVLLFLTGGPPAERSTARPTASAAIPPLTPSPHPTSPPRSYISSGYRHVSNSETYSTARSPQVRGR